MEKVELIFRAVLFGTGIVAYILMTVLAIKRKKASGEPVDVESTLADIAANVLRLLQEAELEITNPGSGAAKLKKVLSATKSMCKQASVIFDKDYWTSYVNDAVELININKESDDNNSTNNDEGEDENIPLE